MTTSFLPLSALLYSFASFTLPEGLSGNLYLLIRRRGRKKENGRSSKQIHRPPEDFSLGKCPQRLRSLDFGSCYLCPVPLCLLEYSHIYMVQDTPVVCPSISGGGRLPHHSRCFFLRSSGKPMVWEGRTTEDYHYHQELLRFDKEISEAGKVSSSPDPRALGFSC